MPKNIPYPHNTNRPFKGTFDPTAAPSAVDKRLAKNPNTIVVHYDKEGNKHKFRGGKPYTPFDRDGWIGPPAGHKAGFGPGGPSESSKRVWRGVGLEPPAPAAPTPGAAPPMAPTPGQAQPNPGWFVRGEGATPPGGRFGVGSRRTAIFGGTPSSGTDQGVGTDTFGVTGQPPPGGSQHGKGGGGGPTPELDRQILDNYGATGQPPPGGSETEMRDAIRKAIPYPNQWGDLPTPGGVGGGRAQPNPGWFVRGEGAAPTAPTGQPTPGNPTMPGAAPPAHKPTSIVDAIQNAVTNPPERGGLPTPGFDSAQQQSVSDALYGLAAPRIQEAQERDIDFAENRLSQRGIPLSSSGARATLGDIRRGGSDALGNLSLASVLGGAQHGLAAQGQEFNQGFANQGADFYQQLALNRLPFEQYQQLLSGVQQLPPTSQYAVASGDYQGLNQADKTAAANQRSQIVGALGSLAGPFFEWLASRNE